MSLAAANVNRVSGGPASLVTGGGLRMKAVLCILSLGAGASTGCGPAKAQQPRTQRATGAPVTVAAATPVAWTAELDAIAAGCNTFARELLRPLGADGGDTFFSPFSVHAALAMTAVGARGDSFAQLAAALHLPDRTALPAAGAFVRFHDQGDRPYELAVANALWGQEGLAWEDAFASALAADFGAGFQTADFAGDPDGERRRINGWVGERTRDRIPELIVAGQVTELTRLVLTNAIFFKGRWATPFEPALTTEQPFHRADGTTVPVPLMHRRGQERHFAGDGFQVLALPYAGGGIECVVILPRAADGLRAVEERFTPTALAAWLDAAEPVKVAIWLPRFRLERRYDLVGALATLGVRDLFIQDKADLSGMTAERLAVGRVVHQAFVEVNEEGTEAAAATAVIANAPGPPPPRPVEFRADRPFLFLIRDRVHGVILFIGRSTGPA